MIRIAYIFEFVPSKQAREVGDRMLKEEKQVQDTRDITSGINPFLVQSSKQDQEIFLNLKSSKSLRSGKTTSSAKIRRSSE